MRKLLLIVVCGLMIPAASAQKTHKTSSAVSRSSAVYPIEEGLVDANGVFIYYTAMGKGDPLLVVHGGPGASHDYFLPYLLPLARTNRLVFH